jgi:hypothetical protein
MEAKEEIHAVRVKCGEAQRDGSVSVLYYNSSERLRRALGMAGICLGVLVGSALIPGAHFVLVPTVLIATPFIVYRRWRLERVIKAADIACAACGGALTRITSSVRYPFFESCLDCKRENRIDNC